MDTISPPRFDECSSRDESGWTAYLDQASNSTDPYRRKHGEEMGSAQVNRVDQEDDGGLSMVSDATSGPPNFGANNTMDTKCYRCPPLSFGSEEDKKCRQKSSKRKEPREVSKCLLLCLDDTASSPIFHNLSRENVVPSEDDESQLLSADAHVEGDFGPKNDSGFSVQAVTGGKSGCSLGRKRGDGELTK